MFLADSNRVSAATVASTAIAAAQWAVTQVWKSILVSVIFIHSIMRNSKKVQFVFVSFCFQRLYSGCSEWPKWRPRRRYRFVSAGGNSILQSEGKHLFWVRCVIIQSPDRCQGCSLTRCRSSPDGNVPCRLVSASKFELELNELPVIKYAFCM